MLWADVLQNPIMFGSLLPVGRSESGLGLDQEGVELGAGSFSGLGHRDLFCSRLGRKVCRFEGTNSDVQVFAGRVTRLVNSGKSQANPRPFRWIDSPFAISQGSEPGSLTINCWKSRLPLTHRTSMTTWIVRFGDLALKRLLWEKKFNWNWPDSTVERHWSVPSFVVCSIQ